MSMSGKHKCPACGQDGGVLLFQQVTECDACRQGRIVVAAFDPKSPPEGLVGWHGFATDEGRDSSLLSYQRKVTGRSVKDVREFSGHVEIGQTSFMPPSKLADGMASYPYVFGAFVSRGPITQPNRAPRVVGRIPDIWTGASGSQRWAEGREVTMILSVKDVPLEKTLHTWAHYPYASAPDCSFRNIEATVQPLLRQPRKWDDSPVVRRAADAQRLLAEDRILLVVRR